MKQVQLRVILLAVISLLAVPDISVGHHSRAHYSREISEMDGVLVEIKWRNPHVYFSLRATDSEGQEQLWEMESGSLYMLSRSGVTRDLFKDGDQVRVAGNVSSTQQGRFLITNMLLSSGQEVVTLPSATLRWNSDRIGGQDQWVEDDLRLRDTDTRGRGFFQVWSVPKERNGRIRANLPFTDSAIAARAHWNPDDNFATRCEPPGMPGIIGVGNPHPFELVDVDETILLRSEEFDVVRTIHMHQSATHDDQPFARLGYSIGHWEDDNRLVVETKRINWPYFDRNGTPQSMSLETVERFILSADQQRLDYHITITDAVTFTEPATRESFYLALDESVERFECEVN